MAAYASVQKSLNTFGDSGESIMRPKKNLLTAVAAFVEHHAGLKMK